MRPRRERPGGAVTQLPTDGRTGQPPGVRKPPGWLQRPAPTPTAVPKPPPAPPPAVPAPPDRTHVDGAEDTAPQLWERLTRGARPADVRDIARLVREPTLADRIPIRIPQRLAFWHAIGAWFATMTLRVRVATFVALVVGVTVAMTSLAAYFTVRVQSKADLDGTLRERAYGLVSSPAADPTNLVILAQTFAKQGTRFAIVNSDSTPLASQAAPPYTIGRLGEVEVATGKRPTLGPRTAYQDGEEFRVFVVPAQIAPSGTGEPERVAFVVAQSTEQTERTLRSLGTALLIIGLTGVLVATATGVQVARQGLQPVGRLTRAAEHVARTGELRPIAVHGDDELARMGRSFNAMLAAVERSRDTQRRLVADAGHELRTPLTSLRTNLDLLKQAESMDGLDPADKAELIEDVRAQVEELTGLVSDLVELARDDVEKSEDRPVDLAETVAAAVERARRRAPHVHFDVRTRPWTVLGDARSLERAVLNLLDNAGKWSPSGGTVTVRLSDGVVSVADQGPGIAEADLPYVFERFYRSDESRTMSGSGLGLAIVRQAAERHGGGVTADRAPQGGALMKLRLPHSSSVTHTDH